MVLSEELAADGTSAESPVRWPYREGPLMTTSRHGVPPTTVTLVGAVPRAHGAHDSLAPRLRR